MMRALWWKAYHDARILLACCALLLFAFGWMFVWLSSLIKLGPLYELLQALPQPLENLSGIPFAEVTTTAGLISVLYVDPIILITIAVWGVARGSDAVSGEIDRGTMEILLAQPIRRLQVLGTQSVVTILGAFLLSAAVWAGTWAGLQTVTFDERLGDPVSARVFLWPALNVFALALSMCAISTFVSSFDRYRARTVGIAGGFLVIEFVLKVIARMWSKAEILTYLTVFGAFEPQQMIKSPEAAWSLSLTYDGVLFGLSAVLYTAAAIAFCRRDVPAPL